EGVTDLDLTDRAGGHERPGAERQRHARVDGDQEAGRAVDEQSANALAGGDGLGGGDLDDVAGAGGGDGGDVVGVGGDAVGAVGGEVAGARAAVDLGVGQDAAAVAHRWRRRGED